MEILTRMLEALQALLLAKVAILLLIGIGAAISGLRLRKPWLVPLGLFLAFGQFVWPWLANERYEGAIAARSAYVRNLPKIRLPAEYPRRLVIEGDITPNQPGWFIAAGYVDEVEVDGARLVAASDAATCRAAAALVLDRNQPQVSATVAANAYKQVGLCTRSAGPAAPDGDTVLLRVDRAVTLHDRENARLHGAPRAIQVSIRRQGRETLAHYDEMPRLGPPSSAIELLPEGHDYPCPSFAYQQIVANLLDAARTPEHRDRLMRRGSNRRSQYDPCIESMPPERYQTGR